MKIGRLRIEMDEKVKTEVVDENGNPVEQQPEKKTDKKKILKRVGAGLATAGAVAVGVMAILGRNGKTSDDPESDGDDAEFDRFDSEGDDPGDAKEDFTEV